MIIGDRLRELREGRKLSQGDIEKRTGLLRSYISRVENGHTVPSIETLEKLARALEVPLYHLFYEGEEPPKLPQLLKRKASDDIVWGRSGKQAVYLQKLTRCLRKAEDADRKLLLSFAQKIVSSRNRQTQRQHKTALGFMPTGGETKKRGRAAGGAPRRLFGHPFIWASFALPLWLVPSWQSPF
jgi:transcriptional regulator with XRE-family HTH domain